MKSCLITVSGLPGSGKSLSGKYLQKLGIPVVSMGEITRDELKNAFLPCVEKNEKYIREVLRNKYGPQVYAERILGHIRNKLKDANIVAVEGVRSPDEIDFFKKQDFRLIVFFIDAERPIRFKRLVKRNERPLNKIEALGRDRYEIGELSAMNIKSGSDYVIENEGTKQELFDKLRIIFQNIKKDNIT